MAKQKVEVQGGGLGDPVDLNERVTMVAPKPKEGQQTFHAEGEETQVAAALVPHFESKGYKVKK
jgi:hypothetical protein